MPEVGEIKRASEIGKWAGSLTVKKRRKAIRGQTYIWHKCPGCGVEWWVPFKDGKPQSKTCHPCHVKDVNFKRGPAHYNWKGGTCVMGTKHQYRGIRLYPDDFFYPMTEKRGYVMEHRLVVAKALGRCLHPWEIVHHKHAKYPVGSVEDKHDNRYPENLQLVTDDRHKQINILENRIRFLESENATLRQQLTH